MTEKVPLEVVILNHFSNTIKDVVVYILCNNKTYCVEWLNADPTEYLLDGNYSDRKTIYLDVDPRVPFQLAWFIEWKCNYSTSPYQTYPKNISQTEMGIPTCFAVFTPKLSDNMSVRLQICNNNYVNLISENKDVQDIAIRYHVPYMDDYDY